jgi:hypothetical protein
MQITVGNSWTEIEDNIDVHVWWLELKDYDFETAVDDLKSYLKQIVPEEVVEKCEIKMMRNENIGHGVMFGDVSDVVIIRSNDKSVEVALAIITN